MRSLSWILSSVLMAHSAELSIPPNQTHNDYSAQNSGKTGLIEMPDARVMDDWRVRPHFYRSDPFIYYGLSIAPLPRTEVNLRITQIRGIEGTGTWSGYGEYKDKAIDLKFLLCKEDELWPAVAIGFDDIHGTGLYSSKYLVATKRFDWLELTGGYALGRMGGEDLSKYGYNNKDDRGIDFLTSTKFGGGSLFGGVEMYVNPDLSIKAEYSPIEYKYDYVNPFTAGKTPMPKSSFNVGVAYKLTDKIALAANFERGTSFGIGLNMTLPFEEQGLYPHEPDPRWRAAPGTLERFERYDDQNLSAAIAHEIAAERYSNVQVAVNENKVWASVENPKYNSSTKALGRAADVIDEVAPRRIDDFYLALKQSDLEYSVVNISRSDVQKIKSNPEADLPEHALRFSDEVEKEYQQFAEGRDVVKTDSIGSKEFVWLLKPSLQTYLNDVENPLTYKFSLLGGARYQTGAGGFVYGRLRFPIANTTDQLNPLVLEPEDSATRTDSLRYIQYNGIQLEDLVYDQTVKLPWNIYGRGEVGYFEPAYGGIDVELYKPFDGGRIGIGLEYQAVKKRKVDELFGFENTRFEGKFINLFANVVPSLGIKATAKIGEFFAGDRGVSLTVIRDFKHFTIGAFLTKTNTDVFTSSENRGYVDKGIFMNIPLSTIAPKTLRGSLHYSLKPWTRDVGQYAKQVNSLIGLEPANIFEMNEDRDAFKE